MDRVTQTFHVIRTTIIAALLLFVSVIANANIAGQVIMVKGTATAISADGKERALQRRSEINANDTIVTGSDSRVQIRFIDNALLALQEKSRLNIHDYSLAKNNGENEKVLMELVEGGFRTLTGSIGKGNREAYAVNTPVASIGVRGTLYSVHLNGEQLSAGVWQGGIVITTPNGREFNLGRDSSFSFGVFNNNNFRGLRTPPADLDAGDNNTDTDADNGSDSNSDNNSSTDTNNSDENSEGSGDNNFDTGNNHSSTPTAPNAFEQMNTDVIQENFIQKFVSENNNISATELQRYTESERYVLINIESQVTLAKWVLGDNNQPIFIVKNDSGIDVYRYSGNNAALPWDSLTPYEDLLNSGIWGDSGQPQAQLHTKNNISTINGPLEWISGNAFSPNAQPSMDSLTIDSNAEFATDSRGNEGSAYVQMNIDLRSGNITDGYLSASFNGQNENTYWEGGFEGGIDLRTGLINTSFSSGTLSQSIGSNPALDGTFDLNKSNIGGFLIGDNEATGFLGWFNIHGSINGNTISAGSFLVGSADAYLGYEEIPGQILSFSIDRIGYALINNEIHMGAFVHETDKTSFVSIGLIGSPLDYVALVARSDAAFNQVTDNANWGLWGSANNQVYIQTASRSGSDMPHVVNSIQFVDFAPFEHVSSSSTNTLEFFASSQNSFGIDSYGNVLSNATGYFLYNQGNGGISNGSLELDFGTSATSTHWSFDFNGGYESGGGNGFEISPSNVTLTVGSNPHSGSQPSATLEGFLTQGATSTAVGGALTAHQLSADDIWASAVIQWNMQQNSITPGGP